MKKYTFRNYFEYLKDNPHKYWFKRKLYGWGWTPATWQGWIITLLFVAILITSGIYFASANVNKQPSFESFIIFFSLIIISIITIIWIAYKTGEKPKWSWGR